MYGLPCLDNLFPSSYNVFPSATNFCQRIHLEPHFELHVVSSEHTHTHNKHTQPLPNTCTQPTSSQPYTQLLCITSQHKCSIKSQNHEKHTVPGKMAGGEGCVKRAVTPVVTHAMKSDCHLLLHTSYMRHTCVIHASAKNRACVRHASGMRQACVIHASGMRQACVKNSTCVMHASYMRHTCVIHASYMRHPCVTHVSYMLQACVTHASGHASLFFHLFGVDSHDDNRQPTLSPHTRADPTTALLLEWEAVTTTVSGCIGCGVCVGCVKSDVCLWQ